MLWQMHCTLVENLECATSLLQDKAYQWWVSVTRTAPPESVTWEFFLAEFRKQYVGLIYLSNMRREFHNLKQRQISVANYQREFIWLSKYALEMLVIEEEKFRKCHPPPPPPPPPRPLPWVDEEGARNFTGTLYLFFFQT